MTEKQILNKVEEYIKLHSYKPVKIDPLKFPPATKSPDYEIYLNDNPVFYAEIKSPLLLINDKTQMYHWRTSISKLRGLIGKAVEQFDGVDKEHKQPRVLIFTSDHMQLNWSNMIDAITGKVVRGNTVISDLRRERYVLDTKKDVYKIDLYLWLQMNKSGIIHQVRFFINSDSEFKSKSEEIVGNLKPHEGESAFKR